MYRTGVVCVIVLLSSAIQAVSVDENDQGRTNLPDSDEAKNSDQTKTNLSENEGFPVDKFALRWHSEETLFEAETSNSKWPCLCTSWIMKNMENMGLVPLAMSQDGMDQPVEYGTEWSQWSKCRPKENKKCYNSMQRRTRLCGVHTTKNGNITKEEDCLKTATRRCLTFRTCNGKWSTGTYNECSVECGGGTKSRIHRCTKNRHSSINCFGGFGKDTYEEHTPCNTHLCPHWSEWYADTPRNVIRKAKHDDQSRNRVLLIKWPQTIYRVCVYMKQLSTLCSDSNNTSYEWKLVEGNPDNELPVFYDGKSGERLCRNTNIPQKEDYTENLTTVILTLALSITCVLSFALTICVLNGKREIRRIEKSYGSDRRHRRDDSSPTPNGNEVIVKFRGTPGQFWRAMKIIDPAMWAKSGSLDYRKPRCLPALVVTDNDIGPETNSELLEKQSYRRASLQPDVNSRISPNWSLAVEKNKRSKSMEHIE